MSRIIYTYKYIYFVLVTFDTWYTTLASTSNLSNLPSIKSRNHGSEGDRHEEIEQGITGITSIGYRPLSLRRFAPLVHDPSLAAFSSSVHQSVHRRLGTLRSTPRARHSFVDRHTAAHESRWSPIVVDRTHERLIDPSSCFLLGPTQGSREKLPLTRARNPDHEFARDSEPTAARKISSARDKEGRDDNLLINLITLREARVG